ncbi:PA2169 family four-helix-bundle protein [Flavobacterium sp. 7A]|uniref:PA2169 family four-helix-bundle protein n=1 Tax=Flavobacterium sp. 7A TaxID=2940571 RepID=UPI002227D8FA|nr:PA2169 family four-helix-bundle protein [Flavobacterium sp. 7A]MCW2119990.1 uncharacterized protein (TIGR02284 family) [Flavobacterium sp. 7A]
MVPIKYTEQIVTKLQNLLEGTYQAEKRFKEAANSTADGFLSVYYEKKSMERSDFAKELYVEMNHLDIKLGHALEVDLAINKAYFSLKEFFSVTTEAVTLQQIIKLEKIALDEYENVLKETSLPFITYATLLKQKTAIESDMIEIKIRNCI